MQIAYIKLKWKYELNKTVSNMSYIKQRKGLTLRLPQKKLTL